LEVIFIARRKDSPQKAAMRQKLRNYLKNNDISIKETDNSRNGHSRKIMHTGYGDMDVAIPKDHNGNYEP